VKIAVQHGVNRIDGAKTNWDQLVQ